MIKVYIVSKDSNDYGKAVKYVTSEYPDTKILRRRNRNETM